MFINVYHSYRNKIHVMAYFGHINELRYFLTFSDDPISGTDDLWAIRWAGSHSGTLSGYLGTEIRPAPILGGVLLVLGMLFYYVGYRANFYFFGYVSCQITAAGLAIWFLGREYFNRLFFLWAFLAFTWPLIFLEDNIAFTLRMFMTQFSSWFLNLIGVENIRQGTAILSAPDAAAGQAAGDRYSLDIANPCSGIRSLFALTMICSIYSYISLNWLG